VNLAGILTASAGAFPERTALKLDQRELSYRALDVASARMAGLLLARGVEPGDRVGIVLPNVPEFALAYYGALRAGAVVVPMDVKLAARELALRLAETGARFLVAWHGLAEAAEAGARDAGADCLFVTPGELERLLLMVSPVRELAERAPSDAAVLELTHGELTRNAIELRPADITLGALPLFGAPGQRCALNPTIAAGGCLTLVPRFDAAHVLAVIERDQVTVFPGVPRMFTALLHYRDRRMFDLSSLGACISADGSLPADQARELEHALACRVVEARDELLVGKSLERH
jgi:long-chain acyl-CoA synthetase